MKVKLRCAFLCRHMQVKLPVGSSYFIILGNQLVRVRSS